MADTETKDWLKEFLKKKHNQLRLIGLLGYLVIIILWLALSLETWIVLGALLSVMLVRLSYGLWVYTKGKRKSL